MTNDAARSIRLVCEQVFEDFRKVTCAVNAFIHVNAKLIEPGYFFTTANIHSDKSKIVIFRRFIISSYGVDINNAMGWLASGRTCDFVIDKGFSDPGITVNVIALTAAVIIVKVWP